MQQAEVFLEHAKEAGLGAALVMHDRDTKFTALSDDMFKAGNVTVQRSPFWSPNAVAFVERFIQTIQQECLDRFVVFGEPHMNHLTSAFVTYYHAGRPHQGKDNELLIKIVPTVKGRKKAKPPADIIRLSEVECRQRLGGLLKHYRRNAS